MSTKLLQSMSRAEKVVLYVVGAMEDLKFRGLVDGGAHRFTERGDQALAALRESGFQPTEEEIQSVVKFLCTPEE